jgi:1,4-dihydroxy-2-naphthoate octaprenyltransferase/chlorophyll synthase
MTASSTERRTPSLGRWLHALKPASWPKLFVPALLGQVLGADPTMGFDPVPLGWGVGFTALGLAFIVLLNDWGDQRVDAIKREMFPKGCSPKTIPDRILSAQTVGWAGSSFGVAALLTAAGAQLALDRPLALLAGLLCMLIFVAYTLPPIRLNYRGGGELLEMLGVGAALPLYNTYLQAGVIPPRSWPWVGGFALLSLSSAVASGLSDEQSDRLGGKRTFACTFGNRAARRLTEASMLLGALIWLGAAVVRPAAAPAWATAAAVGIIAWNFARMLEASDAAVTNAFRAQSAYKRYLHRAVWHSTTVASLILWLRPSLS